MIQSALNRLSERERRHIADLPFIRHRLPVDASHSPNHAGHYYQKGCRREIRVYDRTFASDRFIFVGSPHRPIRNSERTILHEVAHAIAAVPLHRIECALDRLIDQHNDLVESLKADQHRLNEQIVAYNASGNAQRSPQRRHAIEHVRCAPAEGEPEERALARQLNQLRPQAHRLREQMPALVAYQQRAPTGATASAIRRRLRERVLRRVVLAPPHRPSGARARDARHERLVRRRQASDPRGSIRRSGGSCLRAGGQVDEVGSSWLARYDVTIAIKRSDHAGTSPSRASRARTAGPTRASPMLAPARPTRRRSRSMLAHEASPAPNDRPPP